MVLSTIEYRGVKADVVLSTIEYRGVKADVVKVLLNIEG